MTRNRSFSLLLGVRLKSLFLCLPCMVVFTVIFPVVVINSHCQSIHILEQNGFSLFSDRDMVLNPIWEFLVIEIAQHTILSTQLGDIAHEIHIVSGNLVTGLHIEIIQYISHFTYRVRKTKISIQLINKQVSVREPVLQDALVFLVEIHLKLVLGYSSKIGHCKVDFYNIHIKLHQISVEIKATLKQEIIELVRLSTAEDVEDVSFSFS